MRLDHPHIPTTTLTNTTTDAWSHGIVVLVKEGTGHVMQRGPACRQPSASHSVTHFKRTSVQRLPKIFQPDSAQNEEEKTEKEEGKRGHEAAQREQKAHTVSRHCLVSPSIELPPMRILHHATPISPKHGVFCHLIGIKCARRQADRQYVTHQSAW